ncbi:MAG TPA: hypothetical protein VF699_13055 [Caulobacteraceae bacterium]|jgi:hypothetical protein
MDLLETVEEPLKAVAFEGEVVVSGSVCLAMTPEAALASAEALRKAAEVTLGSSGTRRPAEPRSWANGDT